MANKLITATSPYLLQHSHNPVNWYPWGEEAINKAQTEDKPILLSIGYSACHWCHVMERESFEDRAIASLMNQYFICIKVDREERPDIDAIYMDAVQVMGLHGGWPLHIFLLPDKRPFYGGTYFPPKQWGTLLASIGNAFQIHRKELEESAHLFTKSLQNSFALPQKVSAFSLQHFGTLYENIAQKFDKEFGGIAKEPKFPMPSLWSFLLDYQTISQNDFLKDFIQWTLTKIAQGGIYDHIRGGFARYSVDERWFVPHFEKMLYDNAQLLSLYAQAYRIIPNVLFAEVVCETVDWLAAEMQGGEGGFYSSIDADSEGEEGFFYTWRYAELDTDTPFSQLIGNYFGITKDGNWEKGRNILSVEEEKLVFCKKNNIPLSLFEQTLQKWKKEFLQRRNARPRPALDDKILVSWNGLLLKGLCDAFLVFETERFLKLALGIAHCIETCCFSNNLLKRVYKNGVSSIPAYLDDYAAAIQGMLALFQVTGNNKWVSFAETLTEITLQNFYDADDGLFFYTSHDAESYICRKKEIFDNVIPSSNSLMMENLYLLSVIYHKDRYRSIVEHAVERMNNLLLENSEFLSRWASISLVLSLPTIEVSIIGKDSLLFTREIKKIFPQKNVHVFGTSNESTIPFFYNKTKEKDTAFYICAFHTCDAPVFTLKEALLLIEKHTRFS